jgi:hypothetical protein
MSLYIDYIYLDVDERRRFAQESHEYLIDQIQTGLQQTITSASARIDLTLNHPVKELVWVFQDARKLECASTLSSAVGYTQPFNYDDIVSKARLQINGQDRFDERYGDYFFKVQPYQHHTGGAFWPVRNKVASTNSTANGGAATFALTGSGYASITGSTLTISSSATFNPSTVPITENMLVVGAGVPQGTFIIDYGTGAGGAGTYEISTSVSGTVAIGGNTWTFSGPNVQNHVGSFNPINVYSFAIRPEEHQPTGTCNFSRIDTTTLVFDTIASGGAGTYPSKAYPYAFRIYAVNYNILRIMSGMGGLAYSN